MQSISALLIILGILFMFLAISQVRRLFHLLEGKIFNSWKVLFWLILLFTLSYVVALILVFLDQTQYIVPLVGFVFMGGAFFVFLVIKTSLTSSQRLIEINSSKKYLDDIFRTMGDMLIVTDKNLKIQTVNATTCQRLGCVESKLINKSAKDVFDFEELKPNTLFESRFRTKDGKGLPVLVSVNLLEGINGNIYVIVAQDITQQKENEEKLKLYLDRIERKNDELNQFAYIVSHDLKAPLRGINSLAEWIEEDLGEVSDEVQNYLRLLRGRVLRMENLINGILDYSRIGRKKLPIEEVNVNELIHEVLDSLSIPENFTVKMLGEPLTLNTEKILLQQIFSNLISNAVKYHHKEKGNIEIGWTSENENHQFFVADDGPGIAPEYHEKVFGIFQTLEARDTFESTGIGLSIIKKILEEKQQSIRLESEVDKGARFIFTWPN
ncbi:MAG: ATP-binding protein [Marinifilaceae bacterium]